MNENHDNYPLDEFASFEIRQDKARGQFIITVKGDAKYRYMVADKISTLVFTSDDLKKWEVGK